MDIHPYSLEALKVIQEARNLDQATLLLRLAGYYVTHHSSGGLFAHKGYHVVLDLSSRVEYRLNSESGWNEWVSCSYDSIGAVISGEKI